MDGFDLNWICDQVGIGAETRLRRVLYLRLVEQQTFAAIAAEMGTVPSTVRWHLHQGKKRIAAHHWRMKLSRETMDVLEVIRTATEQDAEILAQAITFSEEAQALLHAMRAPNLREIMPALYDELGRRVGAAAQVITVEDVRAVLKDGAFWRKVRASRELVTRPLTEDQKSRLAKK